MIRLNGTHLSPGKSPFAHIVYDADLVVVAVDGLLLSDVPTAVQYLSSRQPFTPTSAFWAQWHHNAIKVCYLVSSLLCLIASFRAT